jgi:hypothetical protein
MIPKNLMALSVLSRTIEFILNSRRECMFIEKYNPIYALIPKGLYVKKLKITYNPFGIKENYIKYSYKHTFPSGI